MRIRILTLGALLTIVGCADRSAPPAKKRPSTTPKPLWLVVTRPALAKTLKPLLAHRKADGFAVELSTLPVKAALASRRPQKPAYILLVGDWEKGAAKKPWAVPTPRVALYRWRKPQRKHFAADALWGDLDGDGRPEVPVGRIPARTPAEVQLVVRKILDYEGKPPGVAGLSVPVWAGAPGYGAAIDSVATSTLLSVVQTEGPDWMVPWMISGDASHALCGPPVLQSHVFNRRLARPALLVAMVGHGTEDSFHSMTAGRISVGYGAENAAFLGRSTFTPPPVVILTCSSGRFDGPKRSLAEAFLFAAHGPVAAIGATTESHPLTNFYTGLETVRALKRNERRLGRLWLDVQRRAWKGDNVLVEQSLLHAEGKITPTLLLAKLRRDQERMYALLGDPATRLHLPAPLKVAVRRTKRGWEWSVQRPPDAKSLLVSHRPAGRPFPPAAKITDYDGAKHAFHAANAVFHFREINRRTGAQRWRGVMEDLRPGVLRFVAIGTSRTHVATHRIQATGK